MTNERNVAKKDLSHVNRATANLSGVDLHAVRLRDATRTEPNLEAADLTDTDQTNANLGGACLRSGRRPVTAALVRHRSAVSKQAA
jgi:uncharacterized protein YjbI with pentapeptide repeats